MENGHEMWYMECKELVQVRVTAVARELVRYKLDLVGIHEVRWDQWGIVKSRGYIFFMEKK
jgi:hypothetical protein